MGDECLLCRAFAGTICGLLYAARYAVDVAACGTSGIETHGSKLARRPSRGIQRSIPERQFITDQAQRLRQDYLAFLIAKRECLNLRSPIRGVVKTRKSGARSRRVHDGRRRVSILILATCTYLFIAS